MHHLDGLFDKTLSRLEQIETFYLDRLPLLSSLPFGLFLHDRLAAGDHATSVLGHIVFVGSNIVEYVIDAILNVPRNVDDQSERCLVTKVLSKIRLLDIPRVSPARIVFEKIKRKHAPSERLSVRIVLKAPSKLLIAGEVI